MADPGQRRMADKNVCPTRLRDFLQVPVRVNSAPLPGRFLVSYPVGKQIGEYK
jgi:hypothetical protein